LHFKLFGTVYRKLWIGFKWNKLPSSNGACYVKITFPCIRNVPYTFYFTKNVKFLLFKQFGTVYRKHWFGFKWNKLPSCNGACYVKITFPCIRHSPYTFYFTKNVKFLHFKLFGTVYSKLWIGFKWNNLLSSNGACYVKMTFPCIRNVPYTL